MFLLATRKVANPFETMRRNLVKNRMFEKENLKL